MYSDLPPHLQTLNALPSSSSPPSTALTAEQEDAFWSFLNTDELFSGFGVAPSAFESKRDKATETTTAAPAPTPAAAETPAPVAEDKETPASTTSSAPTLESFLATFANQTTPPTIPPNFLLSLPSAAQAFTPAAPSTTAAPTPAAETEDGEEPRVTGAKRLKQMGASQAEVEEDKRRRNTEASARFRAKKKERERALEDRASE